MGSQNRTRNGSQSGSKMAPDSLPRAPNRGVLKVVPKRDPLKRVEMCDFACIYYTLSMVGLSLKDLLWAPVWDPFWALGEPEGGVLKESRKVLPKMAPFGSDLGAF